MVDIDQIDLQPVSQNGSRSSVDNQVYIRNVWPFTTSTLKISEMLVFNSTLTQLTSQEDFGTLTRHKGF
jgi:hypothetical protein